MDEIRKLENKIILNSCYYPHHELTFKFYDKALNEKIIKKGREIMREIVEKLEEI